MSIEDVEDFCEVCDGLMPIVGGPNCDHLCKCEYTKVKVVREIGHPEDPSRFYAKWLKLRVRPSIGEFLNVDGDCHSIHMVEHVADSICAIIVWLKPDDRTFGSRFQLNPPPPEIINKQFEYICSQYEAAKWFRTDVWWRKS